MTNATKNGYSTDASPLEIAVFLLTPELPWIHEILPQHIGSGRYGSHGIQKGYGEPDANDGVLLTQSLSGAYSVAEEAAHPLADGKLHETYKQRQDEKERQGDASHFGVDDIVYGHTCDDA